MEAPQTSLDELDGKELADAVQKEVRRAGPEYSYLPRVDRYTQPALEALEAVADTYELRRAERYGTFRYYCAARVKGELWEAKAEGAKPQTALARAAVLIARMLRIREPQEGDKLEKLAQEPEPIREAALEQTDAPLSLADRFAIRLAPEVYRRLAPIKPEPLGQRVYELAEALAHASTNGGPEDGNGK